MLLDFSLKSGLLAIWNDGRDNLTATLKNAHDGSLVFRSGSSDASRAFSYVHIAGFATDERFIGFDFARELNGGFLMQGFTDAMKHMPSGFLRDADGTRKLTGGDAVLAVAKQPVRAHPFIESKRAVFEYRSNLEAELLLASVALPNAAGLNERMLLRPTTRARNNTIRPTKIQSALESTVSVAEVNDGFLKGSSGGVHVLKLRLFSACVKYVVALVRDSM